MAPFLGPSRDQLLAELRRWRPRLPITLGLHQPQAVVDRRDGQWLLLPLRMDEGRAEAAGEAALARGDNWMPENTWQFLQEAEPLIAARDKATFIEAIEALEWRWSA